MIDQEKWNLVLEAINLLSRRVHQVDATVKGSTDALSIQIERLHKKVAKLKKAKN